MAKASLSEDPVAGAETEAPASAPSESPVAVENAAAPNDEARQASAGGGGLDFVMDVPVRLTVEVGVAEMLVREVLQLDKGSVVELDRMVGQPADIYVNGKLVGRGDVTVVDDRIAVRVVEVISAGRNVSPTE